jgi:hypothetical protein
MRRLSWLGMDKNPPPDDFDWVTARAECSLSDAFQRLKTFAARNVETRNKLRPQNAGEKFKYSEADDSFNVGREGGETGSGVTFALSNRDIRVRSEHGDINIGLTLRMNASGECRFLVNGRGSFQEWDILKMALEKLFFDL